MYKEVARTLLLEVKSVSLKVTEFLFFFFPQIQCYLSCEDPQSLTSPEAAKGNKQSKRT